MLEFNLEEPKQALLELSVSDPAMVFDVLRVKVPRHPLTIALAMDLDQPFNAPREVVEVAKDVLEDLHALRETKPYAISQPTQLAAADAAPAAKPKRSRPPKRRSSKR